MKNHFKIIALDTTSGWNLEGYPEIAKIWEIHWANFAEVTHCCEITPSYALTPVNFYVEYTAEFQSKLDQARFSGEFDLTKRQFQTVEYRQDEIDEMVRVNVTNDIVYIHCHSVKSSKTIKIKSLRFSQKEVKKIADGYGNEFDSTGLDEFFNDYLRNGAEINSKGLQVY